MWQKVKCLPLHKKASALACAELLCLLLALLVIGLADVLGLWKLSKFGIIGAIAAANFASILLYGVWLKAAERGAGN